MTMQYTPNLGELPGPDARRDAVHIAVAPVEAGTNLQPGERVFLHDQKAYPIVASTGDMKKTTVVTDQGIASSIGVVDPFFSGVIFKGEKFWLVLYPNTVTSLRHVWTHPAFSVTIPTSTAYQESHKNQDTPNLPSYERVVQDG